MARGSGGTGALCPKCLTIKFLRLRVNGRPKAITTSKIPAYIKIGERMPYGYRLFSCPAVRGKISKGLSCRFGKTISQDARYRIADFAYAQRRSHRSYCRGAETIDRIRDSAALSRPIRGDIALGGKAGGKTCTARPAKDTKTFRKEAIVLKNAAGGIRKVREKIFGYVDSRVK